MSDSNSHIRALGTLRIISGHPGAYLDALRDAKNACSSPCSGREPRPTEKLAFAEFVANAGGRTPRTFALVGNGSVSGAVPGSREAAASFLRSLAPGHYFCKPNIGCNGVGAFRLRITPDCPVVDDEPRDFATVADILSSQDYLIQEWLAPLQHPDIARFNPGVINTLRLVTFDTERGPEAVAASLRMAISLKAIDSWTQGGVVAAIDLEKGVLKRFGILKKTLKIIEAHPGSGVVFRDHPIPHLGRAVATACALHAKLDQVKSLGWDIALLDEGPCVLETNGRWDILMSAQFNPHLVPEFIAVHLPRSCGVGVRLDMAGSFADRDAVCIFLGQALGTSMASGRIDSLDRERLICTVGGTRGAVQTAVQLFKRSAGQMGARRMKIAQTPDKPAPGFDVAAAFAGATESVRPA